jgi:23S rRNA (cytosine1962-C5)-methyltransferase
VMATMGRRGRRFDVVVVDPPSFASRQASVPAARRAYGRLTTLALALLEPGGLLVQASCSSRVTSDELVETVTAAAHATGHDLTPVARTGHPLDHPIGFPEGAYLKALFARVDT